MPIYDFLAPTMRVLGVLAIIASLSPAAISQTSTGPNNPASTANIGSEASWSGAGNISSSNDSYAETNLSILSLTSRTLMATNFGFSISSTHVIDGIKVEIERNTQSLVAIIADNSIRLTKNGTSLTGINKASSSPWPGSDAIVTYGGSEDLWGSAWTPAEINSPSFGLGVSTILSGLLAATARIDHISITVYHHSSILPISLSSFEAMVTNTNSVRLNWSTASEINNDFFTVERSVDGESYIALADIQGSGVSNSPWSYSYEDRQPRAGRSYYRLKQTDFDGTYTHSHVVRIDYDGPEYPALTILPNSVTGTSIGFRIVGIQDTMEIVMLVCDPQGRVLAQQEYAVTSPGVIEDQLELDSPLSAGLYIIKAGPGFQMTRKLVVQ